MSVYYGIGAIVTLGLATFAAQVFCEVQKTKHSPATLLESIKKRLQSAFSTLGDWVAFLSSYLQWLKMETLVDAAVHLLGPLFGILLSWTHFFVGYFKKCFSYATPLSICIGTLLPLAGTIAVVAVYTDWFAVAGQFLLHNVGTDGMKLISGVALVLCGLSVAYYQKASMDLHLSEEEVKDKKSKSPKVHLPN